VTLHRVSQQKAQMLRIAMEEKRHETIARIAAGITHNFNNMLGVSFGNIMLVESLLDKTLDSTCREALADVRKSLERMQQMVRRFLILTDRSKLNDFIPVSLDLCALLDEVNADLKSQNEQTKQFPNVGIDSRVEPGTKIFCSENHAREMFHMIFTEAIETSLGRVRIRATTDSTGGEDLLINLELEHFSIPESIRDSIFEPFAMPLANVGTGLAFAVARQLAEKNGGTISAIFDSPGSTRFVIRMKKG
jgi:signal transduction histidine kinase